MTVLFLRHAHAEDEHNGDFGRRLTPKGLQQSEKVGRFLLRNGLLPDLILSSPVVRARQTAEMVAQVLGLPLTIVEWLACGMKPGAVFENTAVLGDCPTVLLVGHEPDFSQAVSAWIGAPRPDAIEVKKASVTALDVFLHGREGARLLYAVPPRLM